MFSLSRIPFERDIGLLLMQDSIVHCLGFIIEKVSGAFIFAKTVMQSYINSMLHVHRVTRW